MENKSELNNQIPLTEPTFYILLSLAPGPKHGYGIMKETEALSKGRVRLSTGTLYGAIKRLLENDWIQRLEHPADGAPPRERRRYQLSDNGRRVLNAETERMQQLVKLSQQIKSTSIILTCRRWYSYL